MYILHAPVFLSNFLLAFGSWCICYRLNLSLGYFQKYNRLIFSWCMSCKWSRIYRGQWRTSSNQWPFLLLTCCFALKSFTKKQKQKQNKMTTTMKVKPVCNMIQTFSVFQKYDFITQYHWKLYDVVNAFQHFQLPKQLSSLSVPKNLALPFILPFKWISNALPNLWFLLVIIIA